MKGVITMRRIIFSTFVNVPQVLIGTVLRTSLRKFCRHFTPFSRTNFRINSYLLKSIALFNLLNGDGRVDLLGNSVMNIKTNNNNTSSD